MWASSQTWTVPFGDTQETSGNFKLTVEPSSNATRTPQLPQETGAIASAGSLHAMAPSVRSTRNSIVPFNHVSGNRKLALLVHRERFAEDAGVTTREPKFIGVSGEPGVLDSLGAGVDVVSYSGDKLLGGPQAGMLSGRGDLIARMRSNSLFRALRVDKLTYAALEATLLSYVKHDHEAIPALRMMHLSADEIGQRAEAVAAVRSSRLKVEIIDGESVIGGGAAPSAVLPTRLLAVTREGLSADEISARLRMGDPPVIARVEEGRVLLDLRTVFPEQDAKVLAALRAL